MRDLFNNIEVRRAESPIATANADNTVIVSEIIDMRGFKSMIWVIITGGMVDAAFTTVVLMEEGDDSGLSDAAAVPDASMLPAVVGGVNAETIVAFDQADDDQTRKIGYIGEKRFVRLTITPSDNTGDLPFAMIAIMGDPDQRPTTTQAT